MMYIEKHWEMVNNLIDVSRILREYYNRELADELDNLIEVHENRIKELEEDLRWWKDNFG